jgi:hypothetical protein
VDYTIVVFVIVIVEKWFGGHVYIFGKLDDVGFFGEGIYIVGNSTRPVLSLLRNWVSSFGLLELIKNTHVRLFMSMSLLEQ